MDPALPEYQFTEIPVCGYQQRASVVGLPQHLLVRDAGGGLSHIQDAVPLFPESLHYRAVHALIREQVHAGRVPTG